MAGDANTTGTTLHQQPFWRATVSSTQAPALKQVAAHSQAILGSAAASTGDIPLGTGRHCSSGWACPPPVSSAHTASPMPEPERVIATEVAFDQLPGHFQPRQAGHTWRRRVIALALGDIRAIDAGDRDLDQHFSRPWARNRTLRWLQYMRCTGRVISMACMASMGNSALIGTGIRFNPHGLKPGDRTSPQQTAKTPAHYQTGATKPLSTAAPDARTLHCPARTATAGTAPAGPGARFASATAHRELPPGSSLSTMAPNT